MALQASSEGKNVYSLGELIHNPQFVEELRVKGIKIAKSAHELRDSVVIIRSHGVSADEYDTLVRQNNTIVDATCPYVSKTHDMIRQANAEGYPVLILGDANHPEVIGMKSYGNSDTQVVAPKQEQLPNIPKRLCVISQTTQKLEHLQDLVCRLLPKAMEIKIYNSICLATTQRQNSSQSLAKQSDLMIVVGGKQSSNTKMLAKVCEEYCPTLHIETEEELHGEIFRGKELIGIAAGASTPESRIVKVYNEIIKINGDESLATSIQDIPLFKEESC
jgi:(E)-4-hydroxy-3-methyl-but-2-enyl pyrophosphate reductase